MTRDDDILVVEDDAATRSALQLILRAAGYEVACAGDGREALDRLREKRPPCLILLDLMMPVMDGRQFREEQRRDPALAGVPVVLVSADMNLAEKAADLGASGYLQKPVEIEELLELVRRHC